jgi:hypothetical protein
MHAQIDFSRENGKGTIIIKFYDPSYIRVIRVDDHGLFELYVMIHEEIRGLVEESFLSVAAARTLIKTLAQVYYLLEVDLDMFDRTTCESEVPFWQLVCAVRADFLLYYGLCVSSLAGDAFRTLVLNVEL